MNDDHLVTRLAGFDLHTDTYGFTTATRLRGHVRRHHRLMPTRFGERA
jgi:hypothetical protein